MRKNLIYLIFLFILFLLALLKYLFLFVIFSIVFVFYFFRRKSSVLEDLANNFTSNYLLSPVAGEVKKCHEVGDDCFIWIQAPWWQVKTQIMVPCVAEVEMTSVAIVDYNLGKNICGKFKKKLARIIDLGTSLGRVSLYLYPRWGAIAFATSIFPGDKIKIGGSLYRGIGGVDIIVKFSKKIKLMIREGESVKLGDKIGVIDVTI